MSLKYNHHRFAVAPMMAWTDRHCRFFLRQFTKHALLYTEMVSTNALLFSKKDYLLYSEEERPLVLQLGGSEPNQLARCAKIARDRGYDEINLNVGCPSYRAQKGHFGAYLMAHKNQVAACISAMKDAAGCPVTVKMRIGIDEQDSYNFLCEFIDTVSTQGGCETFIIHARKGILIGFNSKDNRKVPPLNYDFVYQLKQDFPGLQFVINGGINSIPETIKHLKNIDGVMIGRAAYKNPSILFKVDSELFHASNPLPNQVSVIYAMLPYILREICNGVKLSDITRHMLGLFCGFNGARKWRRYLSENSSCPASGIDVVIKALSHVEI